jgi:hypothetical protein
MLELRCRFKKVAELDPATVRLVYKCPTCSRTEKRDVFHEWPLMDLLQHILDGDTGIVPPHDDHLSAG